MFFKKMCEKRLLKLHSLHKNWNIGETKEGIELRRASALILGNFNVIMKFKTWYKFNKWLKNYMRVIKDGI